MLKRILIAEDDVTARKALVKIAGIEGYDVLSVGNGFDLLTVINEADVDVVITDLNMPYLSGTSAAEIMQSKGDKTPIIGITGLPHCDLNHIETKFVKIYYKPLDTNELFGYIKTLF